jgi:hypothetical protein
LLGDSSSLSLLFRLSSRRPVTGEERNTATSTEQDIKPTLGAIAREMARHQLSRCILIGSSSIFSVLFF